MEVKWVVTGKDNREVVYIRTAETLREALGYFEECKKLAKDCTLRRGEFYTLEEADGIDFRKLVGL